MPYSGPELRQHPPGQGCGSLIVVGERCWCGGPVEPLKGMPEPGEVWRPEKKEERCPEE